MTTQVGEEILDPTEIERLIRSFADQEARDPRAFAEAVADNIMDPVTEETAALRSDELAPKTLIAVRFLIDHTLNATKRPPKGSDAERRRNHFLTSVNRERRVLEMIVAGIRAKNGVLPNAPNPRARALQRLANENLAGDVPRGRFRDLLNEEEELVRARKREAKQARRDARKGRAPSNVQPAPNHV